jgi:hypothetical protein
MNLDDFNKSLTGLVEEREKDTNKKDKNQFMSLMAVAEHGRPFERLTKMAVAEHGRPFELPRVVKNYHNRMAISHTRMAIGEHGRPFDTNNQEEMKDDLKHIKVLRHLDILRSMSGVTYSD